MILYSKKRTIKPNSGFSLIEILLTLAIISVGTIGVGKLYAAMISGNSDASNRFQAATFAEAKLESLRFSHKVGDNILPGTETIAKGNNTYNISWETAEIGKGQASIKTTVQWQDRNGNYSDNTTVSLSTISSQATSILKSLAPAPALPEIDIPGDKCNQLKIPMMTGSGAYGSDIDSTTSCGSGAPDTGSS